MGLPKRNRNDGLGARTFYYRISHKLQWLGLNILLTAKTNHVKKNRLNAQFFLFYYLNNLKQSTYNKSKS